MRVSCFVASPAFASMREHPNLAPLLYVEFQTFKKPRPLSNIKANRNFPCGEELMILG